MNLVNPMGSSVAYQDYRYALQSQASREYDNAQARELTGHYYPDMVSAPPRLSQHVSQLNAVIADKNQTIEDIKANQPGLHAKLNAESEINNIIRIAKRIAEQGSTDSNDLTVFDRLANDVDNLKASIVDLANTQDVNKNYIFGGTKNDKPPFTIDPNDSENLIFSGNDYSNNEKDMLIGEKIVKVDFPPNAFFRDLYAALDKLSQNLSAKAVDDPNARGNIMTDHTVRLDASLKSISLSLGNTGRVIQDLETQSQLETTRVNQLKEEESAIKDIPLHQALTDKHNAWTKLNEIFQSNMAMETSEADRMSLIFRTLVNVSA